jgi:deoxyribodipyrimidine photo-lyase
LRVHDHAALRAASHMADRDGGAILPLYILPDETEFASPFLIEALRDLQAALAQRGAELHLRYGAASACLAELHRHHKLLSLHTHDCRGEDREAREIETWSLRAGVPFRVAMQYGPVPPHAPGDLSLKAWEDFMAQPRAEAADIECSTNIGVGAWPDPAQRSQAGGADARAGGRAQAIKLLRRFLGPASDAIETSPEIFAQLRPHLELGTVSTREVWQAMIRAQHQFGRAGLDLRAAAVTGVMRALRQHALGETVPTRSQPAWEQKRADPGKTGPDQQMSFGFGGGA